MMTTTTVTTTSVFCWCSFGLVSRKQELCTGHTHTPEDGLLWPVWSGTPLAGNAQGNRAEGEGTFDCVLKNIAKNNPCMRLLTGSCWLSHINFAPQTHTQIRCTTDRRTTVLTIRIWNRSSRILTYGIQLDFPGSTHSRFASLFTQEKRRRFCLMPSETHKTFAENLIARIKNASRQRKNKRRMTLRCSSGREA